MPMKREPSTPPPMIGKIGPYTVFMTPPSTPSTTEPQSQPPPLFESPKKVVAPPPVQPPPLKLHKSQPLSDGSVLGFFRNAATRVQNAHSSLDDHLARWFGLNQSKYQWALDDYYESRGLIRDQGRELNLLRILCILQVIHGTAERHVDALRDTIVQASRYLR